MTAFNLPPGCTLQSIEDLFECDEDIEEGAYAAELSMQSIDTTLPGLCVRNALAEHPGLRVEVSAARTEEAMLAGLYAGLRGTVTTIDDERGECLVRLDQASYGRYCEIERARFSDGLRDLDEDQWFCSGILEVVNQEESEK